MFIKKSSFRVEELLFIVTMIFKLTSVDNQWFNICVDYIPTSVIFKDYDINIYIYTTNLG